MTAPTKKDWTTTTRDESLVFGGPTGTIGKAFTVLRCFVDRQDSWGVRELAATLGQPQSSIHRILKMLTAEGLLEFDKSRQKYQVGTEFYRFAAIINSRLEVAQIALPFMRRLTHETSETCILSLVNLDTQRVVHVSARESDAPLRLEPPIGVSETLTESTAGLAALAYVPVDKRTSILQQLGADADLAARLDGIAFVGYATSSNTAKGDSMCISAPVLNARGMPVAALTLIIPSYRVPEKDLPSIGLLVSKFAQDLSRTMGAQILSGSPTSSWHAGATALASILGERLEGYSAHVRAGGGRQNLEDVQNGHGAYCLTALSSLVHAYDGSEMFKTPLDNLRAIMNVSTMDLHILIRQGLPIYSTRDLLRYRISPGQSTTSTSESFYELLNVMGYTTNDIAQMGGEVINLELIEAERQFRDGYIDVLFWFASTPNEILQKLPPNAGNLVDLDADIRRKMIDACPAYSESVIPASTYPGQVADVTTIKVPTTIVTNAQRPMAEVYWVTCTIYEQRDNLSLLSKAFTSLNRDIAEDAPWLPIHPGAKKYWDEFPLTPPLNSGSAMSR